MTIKCTRCDTEQQGELHNFEGWELWEGQPICPRCVASAKISKFTQDIVEETSRKMAAVAGLTPPQSSGESK